MSVGLPRSAQSPRTNFFHWWLLCCIMWRYLWPRCIAHWAVSTDLKPSANYKKAASRGQRMLTLIKIAFKFLQPSVLCMLYKAFVRLLLEYCCSDWCPFYVKDVDVLERVQRRMTRLLPELQHLSYEERLQYFHLTTLKTRGLRYDLICVYRMLLKGLMSVDQSLFFTLSSRISRSNSLKLNVKFSRLDMRHHFFSHRIVSTWNDQPKSCVEAQSVNSFKRELDVYLLECGFHWLVFLLFL